MLALKLKYCTKSFLHMSSSQRNQYNQLKKNPQPSCPYKFDFQSNINFTLNEYHDILCANY